MNRQKLDKWLSQFKQVKSEIQHLCLARQVFLETQEIIKGNEDIHLPSAFYGFLSSSYASYAVISVRRLVRNHKDSISFTGLLKDIADNANMITVEWYESLYEGSVAYHMARRDFEQFSNKDNKFLCTEMVLRDLSSMKSSASKIEDYADKVVAHLDKREPAEIPTFDELHSFIDYLDKLACKYQLLLTASCSSSMNPTIQENWKKIFEYPWLRRES
jgi:hypothetical protein